MRVRGASPCTLIVTGSWTAVGFNIACQATDTAGTLLHRCLGGLVRQHVYLCTVLRQEVIAL
jgi:hypothetical protein